uniref:Uncharacterized protein n=1 Tax=viral metagenome TaxID=1070528 RepID=A0A6C0C3X8_9ZZZZ
MTISIVRVRDNADCYKFELSIFINEFETFLESNREEMGLKDFIYTVIKSYGIIGNTISHTLMNVMARDLKEKNYPNLIKNAIEATLCFIMRHSISKKYPDVDLTKMTKVMEEKWTAILREIESTEI